MEVHHHSHTARKKWTHYFWEFFMLFLAVFCGFLAENQREHFVEHQREKKFMQLLIEDLATDTTELTSAISKCDTITMYSDSVLVFLSTYKISNSLPIDFTRMVGLGGQRMNLISTDRTSSQLKNAGGMRLIRNKKVSDAILFYWKQINETAISLDRYMVYRDASRSLIFKLWIIPDVYRKGSSMPLDSIKSVRVIDMDSKKWDEFSNLTAIMGQIARQAHAINLRQQLSMAKELIDTIKKEYHLE